MTTNELLQLTITVLGNLVTITWIASSNAAKRQHMDAQFNELRERFEGFKRDFDEVKTGLAEVMVFLFGIPPQRANGLRSEFRQIKEQVEENTQTLHDMKHEKAA